MSDPLLAVAFVAAALVSFGTSWILVSRLERLGAGRLSEAALGLVAALAADSPEITAAITALAGHQARIGAGVVIGSNVFNLAALLGLAGVIAGQVALHRKVIVLEGALALSIAGACLAVVTGAVSPVTGLVIGLIVLVPYGMVLGVRHDRLQWLPGAWARWLTSAVIEEELELKAAVRRRRGVPRDVVVALAAVLVVVGASITMEQAASRLGGRHHVPEIVVGGLILAGVTSLPNAVAAVYLARRGRGAATLSTAMNSNVLNVLVGFMLPGAIVGLGAPTTSATFVGAWYLGLTALTLGCAYRGSGLLRGEGLLIVGAYLVFVGLILARAYASTSGMLLGTILPFTGGGILAAWLMRRHARAGKATRTSHGTTSSA